MKRWTCLLACALALGIAHAEPDEDVMGKPLGYPLGTNIGNWYSNPYRVGSWSALDRVPGIRSRSVARGGEVSALPAAAAPPEIRYRYRNIGYSLDDYLNRRRITSLLIIKNGQIVAERYRYGRNEDARFLSFSMAKSVTSLLMGVALDRGVIASLDDPAEKYVTDLQGSAYGGTSLRHLLRMSSGVTFSENYSGQDDVARLARSTAVGNPRPIDLFRSFKDRHAEAGAKFVYASIETEILGRVLAAASRKTLAELTSQWIWQPLGAERDAFWRIGPDGQEHAYAAFNASLRDWGRLGWMLAQDGRMGQQQIVPREYLMDATDAERQPSAFKPQRATRYFGYGYQFWLFPMKARSFALQGVHGQSLFVQPSSGIVMVQTAAYEFASGAQDSQPYEERDAFWRGVLRSLGGSDD